MWFLSWQKKNLIFELHCFLRNVHRITMTLYHIIWSYMVPVSYILSYSIFESLWMTHTCITHYDHKSSYRWTQKKWRHQINKHLCVLVFFNDHFYLLCQTLQLVIAHHNYYSIACSNLKELNIIYYTIGTVYKHECMHHRKSIEIRVHG
jgi:hypothetical protein